MTATYRTITTRFNKHGRAKTNKMIRTGSGRKYISQLPHHLTWMGSPEPRVMMYGIWADKEVVGYIRYNEIDRSFTTHMTLKWFEIDVDVRKLIQAKNNDMLSEQYKKGDMVKYDDKTAVVMSEVDHVKIPPTEEDDHVRWEHKIRINVNGHNDIIVMVNKIKYV